MNTGNPHAPKPLAVPPATRAPRTLSAAILAAFIACAGCSTNQNGVNTVEPSNPAYASRTIPDKRVVRDSETARAVTVLRVVEGASDTGLARVGVEVQNRSSFMFRFNYRFDWFDAQGLPVSSPASTMVSQSLEAGQPFTLTSIAPTPAAKDFRLSIQKSTRGFFPTLRKN